MWKRTSTDLRHVVARPAAPCRAVRAVPARPAVHGQWPAADRRIGDSHGSPFRRCWNHMISWWNWWNPMIFHASIMFNPYFFWIVVLEDVQMLMMLTSPWPGVPRRAVPRPRCTANGWVFLGKITGHLHISWENPWFPVPIFLYTSDFATPLRRMMRAWAGQETSIKVFGKTIPTGFKECLAMPWPSVDFHREKRWLWCHRHWSLGLS